jgi:hypothetical protein
MGKFNCNMQYLRQCHVKFTSLQSNPSAYYCNVRVSVATCFHGGFRKENIMCSPCFSVTCDVFHISYHTSFNDTVSNL